MIKYSLLPRKLSSINLLCLTRRAFAFDDSIKIDQTEVKNILSQKCFYKIQSISTTADKAEIKKTYRDLTKKYHPDLMTETSNSDSNEIFTKVNNAYTILMDSKKREKYDLARKIVEQKYSEPKGPSGKAYSSQDYDEYVQQSYQYQNARKNDKNYSYWGKSDFHYSDEYHKYQQDQNRTKEDPYNRDYKGDHNRYTRKESDGAIRQRKYTIRFGCGLFVILWCTCSPISFLDWVFGYDVKLSHIEHTRAKSMAANPIFRGVINETEPDFIKQNRMKEMKKELDRRKISIIVLEGDKDTYTRKIGRHSKPRVPFIEEINRKAKGQCRVRKSRCKKMDASEEVSIKRENEPIGIDHYYHITTDQFKRIGRQH